MRKLLARAPFGVKLFAWDLEQRLRLRRSPITRINRAFVRSNGLTVRRGPFAGMVFPDSVRRRIKHLVPFLTGSYEQELHEPLERLLDRRYDLVVDIGAAEGYYAVGLARTLPEARVIAYEMLPVTARVCRWMAEANGVADRVDVRNEECTVDHLANLDGQSLFVFCDAEGAEQDLMDPERVPALARAAAVVELHDWARPGVSEEIIRRFEPTHEIEVVHSGPRYMSDYPEVMEVPGVTFEDRELGVSEIRHSPCAWAVLRPRA